MTNESEKQALLEMFVWYDGHDMIGSALILEAILGRPQAPCALFSASSLQVRNEWAGPSKASFYRPKKLSL